MRQIVGSVIVILVVASLGVMGTFAHFVDTEVSQGNVYQAGILNLILSDGDPASQGDGIDHTWNIFLAFPHDSVSRSVHLTNFGTVGDYVDVEYVCTNSWHVSPPPDHPLHPKDAVLIVTGMTYARGTPDEETLVWVSDARWPDFGEYHFDPGRITDYNADGLISLDDLERQRIEFSPAPDAGPLDFRMSIQFEPQFGPYPDNEYQDVETDMTVIFTLR